jgi:DNA-directed RNA polymerase subunit RPC12/RpoP
MIVTPKGHYECPRCLSKDVYESEESIGAVAMTLDTPGPVNPTLINSVNAQVYRCRNCGEKAQLIFSQKYIAQKARKEAKAMPWATAPFAIIFLFVAIYIFNDPYIGNSGTGIALAIGCVILSLIFGLVAFTAIKAAPKKRK